MAKPIADMLECSMGKLISSISKIFTCLLLLWSRAMGSPLEKSQYRLFIFGDSTVDTGNNNYVEDIPSLKARYPPYGLNGFFGGPTGRFSDGRVVVDFIAEYAGLPYIPPFLQPSANFDNGANFASGGASILPETNRGWGLSLGIQLSYFKKMQRSLVKEIGEAKAREQILEAVYLISIGSNDYIVDYIFDPDMRKTYPPDEYVGMVIGNLTQAIQELYKNGARKFCFLNLGPLGCVPAIRALSSDGTEESCIDGVSELAVAHNNMLSASLVILEYIHEGFKYVNPNAYDWINNRIHHPSKYGFKDGVNACCGNGAYRGNYSCGDTKEMKEYELCAASEENVWWDSYHLSENTQEQIAKELWSNTSSPHEGSCTLKDLFFTNDSIINDDTMSVQDEL